MIDLNPTYLETIKGILARHVPECEVRAFGSRVTWTAKDYSDLDLAVVGAHALNSDTLRGLRDAFEESDLPFRVDVVDWHAIGPAFRKVIEKQYEVVQNARRKSPGMAAGWRELPFSEAVLLNPPVQVERGSRYPFVDMSAVSPGSRCAYATEEREFSGGGSRFQHGDTLMARITPCLENGKIARFCAPQGSAVGHGSTEFIVVRGRLGITDTDFAYYLTQWEEVRNYAIGQMTGTSGRQRVPTDSLDHLGVPIPPVPEQRAIAHILGTLDDKIELNRRMSETLEAIARALFKSWFIDFDPVRRNIARKGRGQPSPGASRRPLPTGEGSVAEGQHSNPLPLGEGQGEGVVESAAFDHLFPARLVPSELGEIPEGWETGRLGAVAEHPRRGVQPQEIGPETPYIALEHMRKRCIALSDWGTAEGLESNKFAFKRGEILFGKLRPYFHKVGVAPMDGVCSTDIVVVAPKLRDWFGLVLGHVSSDAFVDYTNAGSTGTKMPRTSWADMARYELVLPPRSVASAFSHLIQPSVDRIISGIYECRTLAALRVALLPKLVSGEMRVKDAERFVKERGL
jgi:type I restriction enzyme S subunit